MLRSTASVRCRPEGHQGISQARRSLRGLRPEDRTGHPLGDVDPGFEGERGPGLAEVVEPEGGEIGTSS
jgi:hypothetical protein